MKLSASTDLDPVPEYRGTVLEQSETLANTEVEGESEVQVTIRTRGRAISGRRHGERVGPASRKAMRSRAFRTASCGSTNYCGGRIVYVC
jgi:hypothetical protein